MPIRTHRGRAAVYRRLWGWPLRSPWHLVMAVIGLIAVATAIGLLLPPAKGMVLPPRVVDTTTYQLPAAGAAVTLSTSASLPTRLSSPPPAASAGPAPEALAVVAQWTAAWVNHPDGITTAQWLAGLKPYTTDEYLPVMATVDPANIPATKVTGSPVSVRATATSVDANVPTDGGTVGVTVILTTNGWRVAGYTKVD